MSTTKSEIPGTTDNSTPPPKQIKLTKPIEGAQGMIREITLREPTFDDYLRCGDVAVPSKQSDGSMSVSVNRDALALWMQQLSGIDVLTLGMLSMRDSNEISSVVLDLVSAGN